MTGTGDQDAVGRVLGTADATPLQFWVAVRPGAYLQLDDVVVTTRELPDGDPVTIAGVVTQVRARHEGARFDSDVFADRRRHAAGAGAGGGRDHHHPGRAGGLRAADAGRAWCTGRSGDARDAALYFDRMERRDPDGLRPRRRAAVPQRRLPRRQPRRARLHLRHLRRGDEDQLRHVPALLGVPLRACSAAPARPPTPGR